jgi:hypothetical protein
MLLLLLQVFQFDMVKAWGAVVTTLVSVSASLYLISVSPWYLLPFAWFIAGTAFTGVRGSSSLCQLAEQSSTHGVAQQQQQSWREQLWRPGWS